jgi:hypothetical protein
VVQELANTEVTVTMGPVTELLKLTFWLLVVQL